MTPEECIARGWYIFPCNSNKEPVPGMMWQEQSSITPLRIAYWKEIYPDCLWGLDCEKSGLFVVDDDRGKKPEAAATYFDLDLTYGFPTTFTARTPSGGFHYYHSGVGASGENKLGYGIDVKSAGGYVIAPCSTEYSVVADLLIPPAPQWMMDIAGPPTERRKNDTPPLVELDQDFAITLALSRLKIEPPAIHGQTGDNHTFNVACRIMDKGVSPEVTYNLMLEEWNDSCQPPWTPEDLWKKVQNAESYRKLSVGISNPEAVFEAWEDLEPPPAPSLISIYKFLTRNDIMSLPPMEWRIHGLLPTRGLAQIYGPSKSGKSFLAFDMGCAIAGSHDKWFGYDVCEHGPVVYVILEGEAALRQRTEAWEKHYGMQLPELFTAVAQPWSIVTAKQVVDLALGIPRGATVYIDTQNRAAPLANENTSEGMGAIIEGAKELERRIQGVIVLVAHSGKDVSKGPRGHSSQIPAADMALEVSRADLERSFRVDKVKDGSDGDTYGFRLKVIEVGVDKYGKKITSCVISTDGAGVKKIVTRPLTPGERQGMSAYYAAAETSAVWREGIFRGVHVDEWRKEFYKNSTGESPEAKKKAFQRIRNNLVDKKELSVEFDLYIPLAAGYSPFSTQEEQRDISGTFSVEQMTKCFTDE